MGNIGTRTDELCIYVQTNQPYYAPHSLVDGSVYIDVFKPVIAYRLDLRLKGYERVKWEELKQTQPGQPANASNITEKMKDKKEIFNHEIPLYQISGNLNVGQYQFPFTFTLPDNIPGSFDIKHLDYEGRVRYSLTAALVSDRRDPIKYKSELIVRQRPNIPNYNAPISSEQAVCVCCLSKGRSRLECSFQTDTYQPGQDAVLMCRADNRAATVAIKSFAVSLYQRISFRTKMGKETNFTRMICSNDFPGVAAGAENMSSPQLMSLKLEDPLAKVPGSGPKPVLQPNVAGQLINCKYDLEVRPVFDAPCSCCSNVPTATIPLIIYAPPLQNWVSAMPMNFKPSVFQVNQIILPIPSMKVEIGAVPSVGISVGMPNVTMKADVGSANMTISGPGISVSGPTMNVTAPVTDVHMNMGTGTGNVNMRIDVPAPTMEINNAHIEVNNTGSSTVYVNEPGVNATMEMNTSAGMMMPGVEMNMQVTEAHGTVTHTESHNGVVTAQSKVNF